MISHPARADTGVRGRPLVRGCGWGWWSFTISAGWAQTCAPRPTGWRARDTPPLRL